MGTFMKKKNTLILGSILAIASPIAAVVSCGQETKEDTKNKTTNTHQTNSHGTVDNNQPANNVQTPHENTNEGDSTVQKPQLPSSDGGNTVQQPVQQPQVPVNTNPSTDGTAPIVQPPANNINTDPTPQAPAPQVPAPQTPSGATVVKHGNIAIKNEAKIGEINVLDSIGFFAVDAPEGLNITNDMIINCFDHVGDVEISPIGTPLDISTPGIYTFNVIDKGIEGRDEDGNAIKANTSSTEMHIRICEEGEAVNGLLTWTVRTLHGQGVLREKSTNTYSVDLPFGTVITKEDLAGLFISKGFMSVHNLDLYDPTHPSSSPIMIKVRDNGIMGFKDGTTPNPGTYNSAVIYVKVLPKMVEDATYTITPPTAAAAADAKVTVDKTTRADGSTLFYTVDGWVHYTQMKTLEAGPFSAGQDVQFGWVKPDSSNWDNDSWILLDKLIKIPSS